MKKITTLILAFLLIAPILLTYPFKASSMVGSPNSAVVTVFTVDENNNPLLGAEWNVTGDGDVNPSGGEGSVTHHTVSTPTGGGSFMVSGYPSAIGNRLFNSIRTSDGPGRSLHIEPGQNKTVTIQYASGPITCTIDMKANGADSITVEPGSPVGLTWTSTNAFGTGSTGFNTGGAVQNTSGVIVNPTETTVYTISNINVVPAQSSTPRIISYRLNDEVSLQTALNNAGYSINVTTDESGFENWNVPVGTDSINLVGRYVARHAGAWKSFGYYVNGNISTFVPLWKNNPNHPAVVPVFNEGDPFDFVIPTIGVSTIGFAVNVQNADSNRTFATQSSLNFGGGDQAAVFNPSPNTYVLGFEDIPFSSSDRDYQDIIVEVQILSGSGAGNCSDQVEVLMGSKHTVSVFSNRPSSWALVTNGSELHGAGEFAIYTLSAGEVTATIAGIQDIPGYSYTVTNTQGTSQTMTLFNAHPSSFTITYIPTGDLNFSISPASDVVVSRNLNQPGQAQQSVSANYISGAVSPVTFTASNLPTSTSTGESVGVSYANQGCIHQVIAGVVTPPCVATLTFTVPYSIAVGTYPITVTARATVPPSFISTSTTFNLVVQPDSSTTASCSVSPTIARVGESVTWTANPPGGAPNPFVFTWSGTDFPTIETTNPYVTSYQSTGVKTASFTMTNGVTTATCPTVTVYVGVAPNYTEI